MEGFSKLSRDEKIRRMAEFVQDGSLKQDLDSFIHPEKQEIFDSFSENTLSNYFLPFGIAPNFLINDKVYHIPMVIEESSVVAAASSAAKFWSTRGGFKTRVISTVKKGHVHFLWSGEKLLITSSFPELKSRLINDTDSITARMQERGGGIVSIALKDYSDKLENYFRLAVDFETADSMGANFINTVLEAMAGTLQSFIQEKFPKDAEKLDIIMSILSNHVPECLVECTVSCPVNQLEKVDGSTPAEVFARKFKTAVDIACIDHYRAATHNKGIMNGIDAVVIATGNDFRAVEAGVHTYAATGGFYKSLSKVELQDNRFIFSLQIPMAVGTVGGLTTLHPLAKRAMQILQNPNARELMMIIASIGLASNFAAVKALVTKGIQQGHMKMHLSNMLLPFQLDADQKKQTEAYFKNIPVSYAAVTEYIKMNFREK